MNLPMHIDQLKRGIIESFIVLSYLFSDLKAIMTDKIFEKMTNILAEELPKDPRRGKSFFAEKY